MFGGWGRGGGGGANPTGSGSSNGNGSSGNGNGGFLEDPFDQQAATDAPAEWEGGGAWDETGGAEEDAGFGQDASGFGGPRQQQPAGGVYAPGAAGHGGRLPPLPGQAPPQVGEQPPQGPPVDAAEVRRRMGMGVCALEALVHGVQGAVIGSIFGVFGGVSEGMQAGARGKPLIQHTLMRARGSAASFGSWIGIYQGSKCSMSVARGGKKDALNAFVAGAFPPWPLHAGMWTSGGRYASPR